MRKSLFALAAAATLFAGAAQAQSANYAIDPTHTFASFEISHFGAAVNRGRFDKKEGTVQFDKAGNRHMEYVNERGAFDDLPLAQIVADFHTTYPCWMPGD